MRIVWLLLKSNVKSKKKRILVSFGVWENPLFKFNFDARGCGPKLDPFSPLILKPSLVMKPLSDNVSRRLSPVDWRVASPSTVLTQGLSLSLFSPPWGRQNKYNYLTPLFPFSFWSNYINILPLYIYMDV